MLLKWSEFKGKEYILSVSRQKNEITQKGKIIAQASESFQNNLHIQARWSSIS